MDTGTSMSDLLADAPGPTLHPSEFVAVEASEFAARLQTPLLVADDPVYAKAGLPSQTVLLRLGNEATRRPGELRWQNIAHVVCHACSVAP